VLIPSPCTELSSQILNTVRDVGDTAVIALTHAPIAGCRNLFSRSSDVSCQSSGFIEQVGVTETFCHSTNHPV
jgi:hypothetical protein